MTIRLTNEAESDLESIWLFTFDTWSLEQADRYLNLIFDEIEYIAKNPLSGKDISEIRKGYRYSKIKAHLIFYKYNKTSNTLEIIRILHERMDIEHRINE